MSVKSDNIVTTDMTVLSDMTGQVRSTAQKVTYVHMYMLGSQTEMLGSQMPSPLM